MCAKENISVLKRGEVKDNGESYTTKNFELIALKLIFVFAVILIRVTFITRKRTSPPYKISVLKPRGQRPVGRHTQRWKDNIKMSLRYIIKM
jgi:hypothetical protein